MTECNLFFLQGRGRNTHAYTHSVSENHRVYLNLESKRFYCLPDNYEIIDPSLSDIIYVLNPTFTSKVGTFTLPLIFVEECLGLLLSKNQFIFNSNKYQMT